MWWAYTYSNQSFDQVKCQVSSSHKLDTRSLIILSGLWDVFPIAFQYYSQQGTIPKCLAKFWGKLWERKQSNQILHMWWFLVNRALPVGTWLHNMDISSNCARYRLQVESQKHCLWNNVES